MWPSRPSDNLPTVLFQHVAKCGGTSLVEHFGSLGRRGICLGFACDTKRQVAAETKRLLSAKGVKPEKIRVIFGHRVYFGLHELLPQDCRYVTLLRDPISRVVSLYNHHAGIAHNPAHPLYERDRDLMWRHGSLKPFHDWLAEDYSGNHMVRFLYYAMEGDEVDPPGPMTAQHLAAAKRFIDACWFVGTTETSDADFHTICAAVGMAPPRQRANVSTRFFEMPPGDSRRQEILSIDALDDQLYQYAVERRLQTSL